VSRGVQQGAGLKSAKEIWDVLKTAHEGDEVTKITMLAVIMSADRNDKAHAKNATIKAVSFTV
jgi:hypothetical protein